MQRQLAIAFLISVCVCCVTDAANAQGQASAEWNTPSEVRQRGHKWIRNHPFTIMGLVRGVPKPFDIQQYRKAGFSSLLAWEPSSFAEILPIASANHIPFHVHFNDQFELTDSDKANEQALGEALKKLGSEEFRAGLRNISVNPGCTGWLLNDEVVRPTLMRYTRHLARLLREMYPDALVYANSHPAGHDSWLGYGTLDRYLDEFAAVVEPDVLMTDVYPLGAEGTTSDDYFSIIGAVREAALAHGMPYWMFIQSFESTGGFVRRLPSESDLRFQMFVPLTYGYTGIAYFTYDVAFERGLIENDGKPNSLYHAAAKANPEVARLGNALRFLTSTDVRYVPGRHEKEGSTVTNPVPVGRFFRNLHPVANGIKAWSPGTGGDPDILEVMVVPGDEGLSDPTRLQRLQNKDGLLGFFRDDQGRRYFMLTNLWHDAGASEAERALNFTVRFSPSVKKLYRLNRITGDTEVLQVDDGVLYVRLPGGTGDLFKYSPDPFPG